MIIPQEIPPLKYLYRLLNIPLVHQSSRLVPPVLWSGFLQQETNTTVFPTADA